MFRCFLNNLETLMLTYPCLSVRVGLLSALWEKQNKNPTTFWGEICGLLLCCQMLVLLSWDFSCINPFEPFHIFSMCNSLGCASLRGSGAAHPTSSSGFARCSSRRRAGLHMHTARRRGEREEDGRLEVRVAYRGDAQGSDSSHWLTHYPKLYRRSGVDTNWGNGKGS